MAAPQTPPALFHGPEVTPFFDADSSTITYVVRDPGSRACAVIDSVMEFDPASGRIGFEGADAIAAFITEREYRLDWLIETHVHADHLSAAPYLQQRLGGQIAIGARILEVQEAFGKVFNEGTAFRRDGSQFDRLLEDGDRYDIGGLRAVALHTPGHTPACMVHVIGDAAFVGDTLFMPDAGSARADFPGGDAGTLYDSIQKVLALPPETRLFMCHDYGTADRGVAWESTVAAQRSGNIHVGSGRDRDGFVALRQARDATLPVPRLILPSLQVNMRAGTLPRDDDGGLMLKLPLNAL